MKNKSGRFVLILLLFLFFWGGNYYLFNFLGRKSSMPAVPAPANQAVVIPAPVPVPEPEQEIKEILPPEPVKPPEPRPAVPEKKEPPKPETPPQVIKGSLTPSDDTNKLKDFVIGQTVPISAQVENTGNVAHSFSVSAEIIWASGKTALPVKIFNLDPDEKRQVDLNYIVPEEAPVGNYRVKIGLENFATSEVSFNVIDDKPKIFFTDLGLSAKVDQNTVIRVKVADDRGAGTANIFYKSPDMNELAKSPMELVSGTEREKHFAFATDKLKKPGNFFFYIEATDTKPQTTRTDEFNIVVIR